MNRLVKSIRDNATSDRDSATELLSLCKTALADAGDLVQTDDDGNQSVEVFTKLISAATQSLNQMGVANEKLIKLAQTMQKYQLKEMDLENKGGKATTELKGSMFNSLNALVREGKDA